MRSTRIHRKNYNRPGHAHELTFGCYQGYAFLHSERTCQWLAESITAARSELQFNVWAYVFMPNHVHLVVHPRHDAYDIAELRKAIKHPTSRKSLAWMCEHAPHWLPRVTRRRGPRMERLFWQSGGGYDRNITDGDTLMAMLDYIHMNPVRKCLVERAADWRWSSAAHFAEVGASPLDIDPIPAAWLD